MQNQKYDQRNFFNRFANRLFEPMTEWRHTPTSYTAGLFTFLGTFIANTYDLTGVPILEIYGNVKNAVWEYTSKVDPLAGGLLIGFSILALPFVNAHIVQKFTDELYGIYKKKET